MVLTVDLDIRMEPAARTYKPVQFILADVLKSKQYNEIASESNEDVSGLTDSERARIETWPIFDKHLEGILVRIGIELPYKRIIAKRDQRCEWLWKDSYLYGSFIAFSRSIL